MTLITHSNPFADLATDAAFRAAGSTFGTNLTTCGWVRQNDTGIVNWTTVTKPVAINTIAGWDLFRMNDSLQGTAPIFLKVEWGTGSATTTPVMAVTVGTGTDGSGNLTGQVGTRQLLFGLSNTTYTSTNPTRMSASTNRLAYHAFFTTNTTYFHIYVERTHDSTGADTSDGIMTLFGSFQGGAFVQYVPSSGTVPAARTYSAAITPATGTGANGTVINLYPVRIWGNMGELTPFLGSYAYFNADLTAQVAVTATCWDGTSRSIWPFGGASGLPTTYGGTIVWALRND